MQKIALLLIGLFAVTSAYSIDLKVPLGIDDVDLNLIDVEEGIQKTDLYKTDPTSCSAIVYILFGSIKDSIEEEHMDLITYNDRTVSRETVVRAREFLQDTLLHHENEYTRSWAGGVIAYTFPRDTQISKWLFDQYFFHDLDAVRKGTLLNVINKGGYDDPCAILMIKDGLMADNPSQILNALGCTLDNHYPEILPDLVASLLSIDDRYKNNEEKFKPEGIHTGGINACHSLLSRAISEYKDDDKSGIYRPIIEEIQKKRFEKALELKRGNANNKGIDAHD
jgi:hypothetical protein